MEDAG
jgi:U4/U6 small nuclear ribonucleoprotein PRP3